ncbi:hypothetical protein B0H19DRAFT_114002 [Mycena capillaripes]|nr:hypothetical protein B0H19DRAFT_114002 [Mycena capillaripes]
MCAIGKLTRFSFRISDQAMICSIWWQPFETIKLFEALSPLDFPALTHLEIKDNTRNTLRYYWDRADNLRRWEHRGRIYTELVTSFLGAIHTGALTKLTTLWVDEKVLVPAGLSVQDLLGVDDDTGSSFPPAESAHHALWKDALGTALKQLESLRVGFGAITHIDAGLILGLCDPTKLTQFGFEWNWSEYARDEPISVELLAHLSRFLELTDVHILFPRPETHLPGTPDPVVDTRTLSDVASIFQCNAHICRVGIGNSVVWERHPSEGPSAILLVSDGSIAPNPAASKFYHAGYMPRYDSAHADDSDNAIPSRPIRSREIEQLRDLLERIMA